MSNFVISLLWMGCGGNFSTFVMWGYHGQGLQQGQNIIYFLGGRGIWGLKCLERTGSKDPSTKWSFTKSEKLISTLLV